LKQSNELIGIGILTILVNIVLMTVKIVVGIVGTSYALIADGIESASDIFSSLITWSGFQLSLKPADKNHPFGHGKIESLAGVFSGLSLFIAAAIIVYNSIMHIRTPHHSPAWFTLPVLILVVIVKEFLSRKVMSANTDIDSQALKGDAWHHRSDAITSGAAAIGITIALIGGEKYSNADDWAALIACTVIVINAVLILKNSLHELLDGSVDNELQDKFKSIASKIEKVNSVGKCKVRKSGIGYFIEIHIKVAPSMTVFEGHTVSHLVKDTIMSNNKKVFDVTVHLEPANIT
jgi:cation diffusion facilitator family transporter